jgi:hypothetical protein
MPLCERSVSRPRLRPTTCASSARGWRSASASTGSPTASSSWPNVRCEPDLVRLKGELHAANEQAASAEMDGAA